MLFGELLDPAESTVVTDWIGPARSREPWTVGQLVPNRYESYVRILSPSGGTDDWTAQYCAVFQTVASIGERHTATPGKAWFSIWEGHGFPKVEQVPIFDLPNRSYYLLGGPVMAAAEVRYPDAVGWQNPDLIWPDDRSWFIATDVDFWSLYVGGTHEFVAELIQTFASDSVLVTLADQLVTEL